MWNLIISGPKLATFTRPLAPGGELVLGRADDNDVTLLGEQVSRRHVQFVATAEGVKVRDLASRNGTQLNGRRLGAMPRTLVPGDVVSLADYSIKCEDARPTLFVRGRPADGFVTLMTARAEVAQWADSAEEKAPPPYMALLAAIAERLAEGTGTAEVLNEVIEFAETATGFRDSVLLVRTEDGSFQPLARPEVTRGPARVWSTTLVGEAIKRGEALFVHHLPTDPRFHTDSVILAGSLHVLCAPLLHRGQAMGALYLATRNAEIPSQESVNFIAALARIAASALARKPSSEVAARQLGDGARFVRDAVLELRALLERPQPNASEIGDLISEAAAAATELVKQTD